jgi:hypothetical protein
MTETASTSLVQARRRRLELAAGPPPRTKLAVQIIGAAFIFNLVLRFYPWPRGFSLNNLRSLSANIVGIAFSLLFYTVLLVLLTPHIRRGSTLRIQFFLVPFTIFLALSPLFRPSPATETVRDLSFILLLGSAAAAATALNDLEPRTLARLMFWPSSAVLVSYVLGMGIALARPGSVMWGSFLLRSVHDRAEFFFFFVPPHISLVFVIVGTAPAKARARSLGIAALALFPVLMAMSLRTHTRTYILGLLVLAGLLVAVRVGRRAALVIAVGVLAAVVVAGLVPLVLSQLRLDSFGKRGIDSTNGRASLVSQVVQAFRSNVAFGPGADAMRRRIESSSSVAKTEYGVFGYLGSFGLLSAPIFACLILSWSRSAARLWRASRRPCRIQPTSVLDCLNLANFPLAFFWLLGSATAFYDWLAFLVAFMCLSPGKLWSSRALEQISREDEAHGDGSSPR